MMQMLLHMVNIELVLEKNIIQLFFIQLELELVVE
jgi:hypothetical protein